MDAHSSSPAPDCHERDSLNPVTEASNVVAVDTHPRRQDNLIEVDLVNCPSFVDSMRKRPLVNLERLIVNDLGPFCTNLVLELCRQREMFF